MPITLESIWFLAAIVGTPLMLPQVIKSYKTKKLDDISLMMVILYVLNCTLWTIYWLLIESYPIILWNFIGLLISLAQLYLKIRYSYPRVEM